MRLKLFCLFLLGFFLIGNVFALTTVVEVKTLPHHRVLITPIATGGGFTALSQPEEGFSSQYGDVVFELDFDGTFFDLNFLIKEGDNLVYAEKVRGNFVSGSLVQVEVLPEGVLPLVKPGVVEIAVASKEVFSNDAEVGKEVIGEDINDSVVVEEEGIKKILLNGYAVIEENKPVVNSIYYSVLGFTALLLIFLTVRKNGNKVEKIEKVKGEVGEINDKDEDELALEEAKAKVKDLENKKNDKIAVVKRKLIEDQKELLRLRGIREQERKGEISSGEMKKRLQDKINEDKY